MLHNRLQSRYTDDSSAETHHNHRRGGADEDGMLGMNQIGPLQPEISRMRRDTPDPPPRTLSVKLAL